MFQSNKRTRVAAGDGADGNAILASLRANLGQVNAKDKTPRGVDVSDDSSSGTTGSCSGDSGDAGAHQANFETGMSAEELEYMRGMMDAMEDGIESEVEDAEEADETLVPQETSSVSVAGQAAATVSLAETETVAESLAETENLAEASAQGVHQDERSSNEADEYDYALGMMEAMEDGEEREGEAPQDRAGPNADQHEEEAQEYEDAMGMMAAMEDGAEEFEDARQENEQEQEQEREQDSTAGGGFGLANLSQNIVQACSSVSQAVREYYKMSQTDQAQVWDDLVGAEGQKRVFVQGKELPGLSETFEPHNMVEEALQQLPLELQRMPSSHDHTALDLALEKAPEYVNARAFLLKFLRSERFDVFAAAARMCRHFEVKLELFGEEALGREITLRDLDEDDMDCFNRGYIQILQDTDCGHRPIIFYYKAASDCYKRRENLLRTYWYMANRMSEKEEVQKLGVGNIVYNVGGFPHKGMDYEKSRRLAKSFKAIPLRFNSFYVCLDDKPWLTVVETFAVMITRFLRVRLRMLKGTHDEVTDKLKQVGVPAEALPVNPKSELLVDAHLDWIEKQREEEERRQELGDGSNPASDLAAENPFLVKESYETQMETLAHMSDITASFYGRQGPPSA